MWDQVENPEDRFSHNEAHSDPMFDPQWLGILKVVIPSFRRNSQHTILMLFKRLLPYSTSFLHVTETTYISFLGLMFICKQLTYIYALYILQTMAIEKLNLT